ncbi:MAG: hypothetical protein JNM91_10910, partial [Flavobacteriales bacterium]|nr:hypothetical protein [Flavobacteriales bacterium]
AALVFDSAQVDLHHVVIDNMRIAADVRSLSARSATGERLALAVVLDASPALVDLRDGHVNVSGNELSFAANAAIGDLSAVYRAPDLVPLRAEVHGELDPVTLRPVLRAFGLEDHLPSELTERMRTDLRFSGSMAVIDTARVDLVGDQGSVLHIAASGTDPARWPDNDLDVEVTQVSMGNGFRQLLRANTPPDLVLPNTAEFSARVQNQRGRLTSTFDLRSDLGDVQGNASASGWSAKLPDRIALDLDVRDFEVGRFTRDTIIGNVSVKVTAMGDALNSTARSGSVQVKPSRLSFNGQDLSSLVLEGRLQGDSVHLDANVDAEALIAHLTAHGRWPGDGDSLAAILRIDLDRARLQPLGLLAYQLDVNGSLRMDAAFDTSGYGRFGLIADSLRLANDEKAFRFTELRAQGLLATDSTDVQLQSDAITVAYRTNLPLDSLVPLASRKFTSYFAADSL